MPSFVKAVVVGCSSFPSIDVSCHWPSEFRCQCRRWLPSPSFVWNHWSQSPQGMVGAGWGRSSCSCFSAFLFWRLAVCSSSRCAVPLRINSFHNVLFIARACQLVCSMSHLTNVSFNWSRKRRLGAPIGFVPASSWENKICFGSLVSGAKRKQWPAMTDSMLGRPTHRSTDLFDTILWRQSMKYCYDEFCTAAWLFDIFLIFGYYGTNIILWWS